MGILWIVILMISFIMRFNFVINSFVIVLFLINFDVLFSDLKNVVFVCFCLWCLCVWLWVIVLVFILLLIVICLLGILLSVNCVLIFVMWVVFLLIIIKLMINRILNIIMFNRIELFIMKFVKFLIMLFVVLVLVCFWLMISFVDDILSDSCNISEVSKIVGNVEKFRGCLINNVIVKIRMVRVNDVVNLILRMKVGIGKIIIMMMVISVRVSRIVGLNIFWIDRCGISCVFLE